MRSLALDIGGVFYLSDANAAFFERWAPRTRFDAAGLSGAFWNGPEIEMANVGLIDQGEYCRRAGERLGLAPRMVAEMVTDAFRSNFNHAFADFVRGLKARGVQVCSLTNNWSSETELLTRPELAGLFEFAISSRDVGLTKPDAEIYRLLIERVGRPADEIVFVDDRPVCVDGGRGAGLRTVQFRETAQAIAEIEVLLG